MGTVRVVTLIVATRSVALAAGAQPTLTGMIEFSCDSSGNSGDQIWNTQGPGATWNIYVIRGAPGGAFINSGDGPSTSINRALAVGPNTFTVHGDYSTHDVTYMGLNLFFDDDNTDPGISVFGANGVAGGSANGGTTLTLDGSDIAGANTLTYLTHEYRVTLSDFLFRLNVADSDRVSEHASTPNGRNDNLVTFTLTVEAISPVPGLAMAGAAALALLLAGAGVVALRRLG